MTDPAVRHVGRGPTSILGRTALHFYEQFCEGKVAFNYGFNVANIAEVLDAFPRAATRVEPVPYRVRDLRRNPLRADHARASGCCAAIAARAGARASVASWTSSSRASRRDYRVSRAPRRARMFAGAISSVPTCSTSSSRSASGGGSRAGSSFRRARRATDLGRRAVRSALSRRVPKCFCATSCRNYRGRIASTAGFRRGRDGSIAFCATLRFEIAARSAGPVADVRAVRCCADATRADARRRLYYTMGDSDLF